MGQRKQRPMRREIVPDYVRTSDSRETSLLATNPAVLKQMEARRGSPLIVPATVKMFGMYKLSVDSLEDLRIDTRYQRDEVTLEVNTLITVIKRGGVIPDPISVAERQYGDRKRYIVDGQQRWWAHVDTQTPVQAIIYHVSSYEDEVALFHALNMQTRVSPEDRLRSWPGPAGDRIRALNETPTSPMYQQIGFEGHNYRFGAMIVLRGLAALLSNTKTTGGLDRIAPAFDRYYRMHPKLCDGMINAYVQLLAQIFEKRRIRAVTAVALGRIVHAAVVGQKEFPNPMQLRRLKALDWDGLTPTHSIKWLPTVVAAVQDIWPIQLVQESK
jgi:hypothetical protein